MAAAFYGTTIDILLNLFILRFYNDYHYLVPSASADVSWSTLRKLGQACNCVCVIEELVVSSPHSSLTAVILQTVIKVLKLQIHNSFTLFRFIFV